jgi:hypothetical protein
MNQNPKPNSAPPPEATHVQIPISILPADLSIPVHFFIYFAQNKTLALWRHAGDKITSPELKRLTDAKMAYIWILKAEIPKFRAWLIDLGRTAAEKLSGKNATPHPLPVPAQPVTPVSESPPPFPNEDSWHARSGEQDIDLSIVQTVSLLVGGGAQVQGPSQSATPSEAIQTLFRSIAPADGAGKPAQGSAARKSSARDWSHLWTLLLSDQGRKEFPRELRLQLSRDSAEALLHFSFSATDPEQQAIAENLVTESVGYFVHECLLEVAPGLDRFWRRLCGLNPTAHALRVASWSVLIAILSSRLHRPLLAELALAGLAHDTGLSTVSARVALLPMRLQSPGDATDYARHVEASCSLLENAVPAELKDLAKRASRILRQHHEKFDGRGFPKALRGFHVEESAQFLCMADLLLTLSEGRWDGIARTHRKSLSVLEKYESAGNFPEFFHPALFQTLSKSAPPATEEQAA